MMRGRSIATLLSDFGHTVPVMPVRPSRPVREKSARPLVPSLTWRGPMAAHAGWAPAAAPVDVRRSTSDQVAVWFPLIGGSVLRRPTGAPMGRDVTSRSTFYMDPHGWVKDPHVPVSNPNIFIFGHPGLGKSSWVKAFLNRMFAFGYRALILGDPKDEYEPLCEAFGVTPFAIGPGMPTRLNPLTLGPLGQGWERLDRKTITSRIETIFARWLVLVKGLVSSQRINADPVPYGPNESAVVQAVLARLTGRADRLPQLTETTIPALWDALSNPTDDLVRECRYATRQQLLDETRLVRNSLAQLVNGHLAGMFDAPTNITIDWDAPIQSLSLSRLSPMGDEAIGLALACLSSWGSGMRAASSTGVRRIAVRDEVWKTMRLGAGAVESMDGDLRLSRANGEISIAVGHKASDMASVGDTSSRAHHIAKDMIHLASMKVLFGQEPGPADDLERLLELGPIAHHTIKTWCMQGPGRSVVCVGPHQYKTQLHLHPFEREFSYTNQHL